MIFGWRLSVDNERLQFDAIAATPLVAGKPKSLREAHRLVGPRTVTVIARLKGSTLSYTSSKLSVPSWLVVSLPSVAARFPKNTSISSATHVSDWAPGATKKNSAKKLDAASPRPSIMTSVRTEHEMFQTLMVTQHLMFDQALERDPSTLSRACQAIRGQLPAPAYKYVDQPPALNESVDAQEYRTLALRWHEQVLALAYLPVPAEIALRIPWQLISRSVAQTRSFRAGIATPVLTSSRCV